MSSLPQKRFYVYTLAYPNGRVFYIGKGSGRRVLDHESEARRGCPCRKCNVIHAIWRDGGQVCKSFVLETDDEQVAYDYEMRLIAEATHDLCNISKGGEHSNALPDEVYAARQRAVERYDRIQAYEKEMLVRLRIAKYKAEKLQRRKKK